MGGAQVSSPVDFNWSPASGALLYRVWVSVNGDPFVDLAFTMSSSLTQQNLPSGTIQWYVEAFFDSCAAVGSSRATFVIPQTKRCGSDAPLLVTPSDGENNVVSPVTFVWTAIADATEYRVFAEFDNGSLVPPPPRSSPRPATRPSSGPCRRERSPGSSSPSPINALELGRRDHALRWPRLRIARPMRRSS